MIKAVRKIVRYIFIYGLPRTLNKVSGRLRKFKVFKPKFFLKRQHIGLIGCGQFQFSTIAYYLSKGYINKFLICYDTNKKNAQTLSNYYSIGKVAESIDDFFEFEDLKLVYIASNHASHSSYAIKFLEQGIDTYSEKPISVNKKQFHKLKEVLIKTSAKFYVGYNRPYSKAIKFLLNEFNGLDNLGGSFTLSCFITAHDIPENHWYRNPEEGTRICGNVGHWIDLMIHMYNWRGFVPQEFEVQIAYSTLDEPDDNISILITTPNQDLTTITISSRCEPFEGINETINFQYDKLISKIDDFRSITLWREDKLIKKNFWPKDVGHKRSVFQPFNKDNRDVNEILVSTELMIEIAEMVMNREKNKDIYIENKI